MTSQTPQSGWPQADSGQEQGRSPAAQPAEYGRRQTPAAPETFPAFTSFGADAAFPPDSVDGQPAPFAGFPTPEPQPSVAPESAQEINTQAPAPTDPVLPWQPADQPDVAPMEDQPYVPAPAVMPVPNVDHDIPVAHPTHPTQPNESPSAMAPAEPPAPPPGTAPSTKTESWAFAVDESKVAGAPKWTPPSPVQDATSLQAEPTGPATAASATASVPDSIRISPGEVLPTQLPKPSARVYESTTANAPIIDDIQPPAAPAADSPAAAAPSQPARASARVQVPGMNAVSVPEPATQPGDTSLDAPAVHGQDPAVDEARSSSTPVSMHPLPQRTPQADRPIPDGLFIEESIPGQPSSGQPGYGQPEYGQPPSAALFEDDRRIPTRASEQSAYEHPPTAHQSARRPSVFDDLIGPEPTTPMPAGTADAMPLNGNHPGIPAPQAPTPGAASSVPSPTGYDGFRQTPNEPGGDHWAPFGGGQPGNPFAEPHQPTAPAPLFGQPSQPSQPLQSGQPGQPSQPLQSSQPIQPFDVIPIQQAAEPVAVDSEQERFDEFKAAEPQAVTPEPKPVRTGLLVVGVVLGCAALLGIVFGGLTLLGMLGGDSSASFKVGDCVKQDDAAAVAADCASPGTFKIISSTDSPDKCEDPAQPHVKVEETVFCLRPVEQSGEGGEGDAPPADQ